MFLLLCGVCRRISSLDSFFACDFERRYPLLMPGCLRISGRKIFKGDDSWTGGLHAHWASLDFIDFSSMPPR